MLRFLMLAWLPEGVISPLFVAMAYVGYQSHAWHLTAAVGIAAMGSRLNCFVVTKNGYRMPVVSTQKDICSKSPYHVLADETTRYAFLADRIIIRSAYLSIGDLLIYLGAYLFMLMLGIEILRWLL